jgi:hypothetical protein
MSFYLYRIFRGEETLYIGKGTGRRLAKQKSRFQADGEIVAYYDDEREAYREEIKLIAAHQPPLNKHPGGQGGRAGLWHRRELPNGFTEEGLPLAAPFLARLLNIWRNDRTLDGILPVVGAYIKAHGEEAITEAVVPYLRRLIRNDLALESKP